MAYMGHQLGNTTYQCLNCRLAQRAEVVGTSTYVHRRRGAGRGEANTSMAMLLALKRCPRCGHFDRNVANNNKHNRRIAMLGYILLFGAVGGSLFFIPGIPYLALVIAVGVLAVAFVAIYFRMRTRYPANAESRVRLIGSASMNQWW
jgi:hypothetical protein